MKTTLSQRNPKQLYWLDTDCSEARVTKSVFGSDQCLTLQWFGLQSYLFDTCCTCSSSYCQSSALRWCSPGYFGSELLASYLNLQVLTFDKLQKLCLGSYVCLRNQLFAGLSSLQQLNLFFKVYESCITAMRTSNCLLLYASLQPTQYQLIICFRKVSNKKGAKLLI